MLQPSTSYSRRFTNYLNSSTSTTLKCILTSAYFSLRRSAGVRVLCHPRASASTLVELMDFKPWTSRQTSCSYRSSSAPFNGSRRAFLISPGLFIRCSNVLRSSIHAPKHAGSDFFCTSIWFRTNGETTSDVYFTPASLLSSIA